MTKTFKTIAFCILMLGVLNAAAQKDRKFHFGLHFSPNISWMKPDVKQPKYNSDGAIIGMSYGAAFENYFSPNLGIGTGVNIIQTGGKLSFTDAMQINVNNTAINDTGIMTRKYKVQYLEIPLFLIGSTGEVLGNFSFYGKFGLSSSFKLKAKADDEFTPSPPGDVITDKGRNIAKDVNFFREAMIIGLGCAYKFGQVAALYAGVTYNNGFTDMLTGKNVAYPEVKEKARANFVELNVGVMF